ncbi:MAG: hypothetical protein WC028_30265 [Candidatus Obscuribacterales bacterium]
MRFPKLQLTKEQFKEIFPGLSGSQFEITSDETPFYNCIAYAAGDEGRWWWPDLTYYWPIDEKSLSVECFISAFETLNYRVCSCGSLEPGYEKVAIYVNSSCEPTHMARQVNQNGDWKSKCGRSQDILHSPQALEGVSYGTIHTYMSRPVQIDSTAGT